MAAEMAVVGKQRPRRPRLRSGVASGHTLGSEQGIVAGAELHFLERIDGPGWAETNQVGFLANPRLGGVTVKADFTPTRPATPQDVEHFITLGVGIVAGEILEREVELVVQLVLEQVAQLAIETISVDAAVICRTCGEHDARVLLCA